MSVLFNINGLTIYFIVSTLESHIELWMELKLLICLFLDFKVRNGSFQIGIDSICSILYMMNKLLWNVTLPKVLTPTLLLIKMFSFPNSMEHVFSSLKSLQCNQQNSTSCSFKCEGVKGGNVYWSWAHFFGYGKDIHQFFCGELHHGLKHAINWSYMSRPIICHPPLCIKLGFLYIVVHMMIYSLLE